MQCGDFLVGVPPDYDDDDDDDVHGHQNQWLHLDGSISIIQASYVDIRALGLAPAVLVQCTVSVARARL